MNAYYVIVPGVLLSMFFGYERHFQREREVRERVRANLVAADRAAKDEAHARQQETARKDTEQRAAEREKQDREKAQQRQREYDSFIATLRSQSDEHSTATATLGKDIETLLAQIDELRAKQRANDEQARERAEQLERQRAHRRSIELDVQRTTELIAAKLHRAL
jgi:hypothetical protein